MSDPNPTTPAPQGQPDAQAGQQGGNTQGQQSPAQPVTPPAAAPQPYRAFADQKELDDFVKGAKTQAERSAIRKLAKDLGFEDADEMRDTLAALRQAQGGGKPNTPEAQAQPAAPGTSPAATAPNGGAVDSTGARLQMALEVGVELGLPATLIARLQGNDKEAMKADAQSLLALFGGNGGTQQSRGPGIPPVPPSNQAVTFTRTQLRDAKFVRENADAIRKAQAEGRIVES